MTPAKCHDLQVCPLSNLCLSGTGRTEPALSIIPPELSACPTWASPSGFQASSRLLQGQRAPLEAQGLIPAPEGFLVAWDTLGLSSRQIQLLALGDWVLLAPAFRADQPLLFGVH